MGHSHDLSKKLKHRRRKHDTSSSSSSSSSVSSDDSSDSNSSDSQVSKKERIKRENCNDSPLSISLSSSDESIPNVKVKKCKRRHKKHSHERIRERRDNRGSDLTRSSGTSRHGCTEISRHARDNRERDRIDNRQSSKRNHENYSDDGNDRFDANLSRPHKRQNTSHGLVDGEGDEGSDHRRPLNHEKRNEAHDRRKRHKANRYNEEEMESSRTDDRRQRENSRRPHSLERRRGRDDQRNHNRQGRGRREDDDVKFDPNRPIKEEPVSDSEEPQWGKKEDNGDVKKEKEKNKGKPDFGLSGKLTEDTNMVNGVVIKYSEPPEARKPKRRWRLYVFKGEREMPTLYIHRQSAYLMGRDRKIADIPIDHPSCSKQHAALQYRMVPFERDDGTVGKKIRPYIIDLESANGTFVNNNKVDSRKYVELFEKDVIKFGYSSREYVVLHEHSKGSDADDDINQD